MCWGLCWQEGARGAFLGDDLKMVASPGVPLKHDHIQKQSRDHLFSGSLPQNNLIKLMFLIKLWGLPWWCSGWESACQCKGHRFEPWSGKIPHAAEQLGPWDTTTEPARLELVLRNKRGHDSERPAHRNEEWPPLAATRESPCTETKTQHSQK